MLNDVESKCSQKKTSRILQHHFLGPRQHRFHCDFTAVKVRISHGSQPWHWLMISLIAFPLRYFNIVLSRAHLSCSVFLYHEKKLIKISCKMQRMYGRIKRIVLSKLNTKRRICPLCTGIRAKLLPYFAHSDSTTDMPHGLQELAAKSRIMLLQRYHAFFLTSKIIRASSLVKAISQEAAAQTYAHICTYTHIHAHMRIYPHIWTCGC